MRTILTPVIRSELLKRHHTERDGRIKDRIKVVLLYDDGWSYASIAEALFLSEEGARQQFKDYVDSEGKKLKPGNGGREALLNMDQTTAVISHLENNLYIKVSDICDYVHKTYGIRYSITGFTDWLKRHNFTFHQPCGVPAKAEAEAQLKFIAKYEQLKRHLPDNDHIVFMDGVHPTHAVRFTKGWIKKGERKEIPTNGSQRRLNILGALNLESMTLTNHTYDTINGANIVANIVAFLAHLLAIMPRGVINVILDQARYHTCKEVRSWLMSNPRIQLHYLPPYSPNLNAIEPCWKIMHEYTTNNIYHPTFKQFTEKIQDFLDNTFQLKALTWIDRLTDNFRAMGRKSTA